jgi:hypothetical protein
LNRRLGRLIGLVLIVAGIAVLAIKAWQVVATLRSLQSRMTQAQAAAQSSNLKVDPAQIEALLTDTRRDVLALRAETGPLLMLAPYLGWLPIVGGDVQAAPALLDMADGLTEAGVLFWPTMSPLVASLSTSNQLRDADMTHTAMAQLAASRPQIEQARAALARAASARAKIRLDQLAPRLQNLLSRLDELLPLAQIGADVALAAPEALGLYGPRTYLILAQNEDELRPTGGFISGAGRATFDRGRLVELSFMDANLVDDLTRPYGNPPEPMMRYMGLGQQTEMWLFRDSNWSPDFPTSARQAAYFYSYGQKVPVDGVVAVDQRAVQMLLTAMGPVNVAISNTQIVITGNNVMDVMREAWNPPGGQVTAQWMATRKGFIGRLAEALRSRAENNPGQLPWTVVGRTMLQALDEKHILIYAAQPDLADLLAQRGWDGAIHSSSGDYLMLVDANMGFNKASASITQRARYQIDLTTLQASLHVDYQHNQPSSELCHQEQPYAVNITYQSMMAYCYYGLLRIYAPLQTHLLDSNWERIPSSYFVSRRPVDSQAQMLEPEAGRAVMSQFLVVRPGASEQITLTYQLPAGVVQRAGGETWYSLLVQKQPGKLAVTMTVSVTLPSGARVTALTPPGRWLSDRVQFDWTMSRDTQLEIRFHD